MFPQNIKRLNWGGYRKGLLTNLPLDQPILMLKNHSIKVKFIYLQQCIYHGVIDHKKTTLWHLVWGKMIGWLA